MIRETVPRFLRRLSEVVFFGRNKSRIVLGTDRKDERDTGLGDGGDNNEDTAMIDMVAGFEEENPDYVSDKSRILIAQSTNPDEYFDMDLGSEITETPAIVVHSDQIYLKARQNIKIRTENVTILIDSDGNVTIEASQDTKIKSGDSVIQMSSNGDISIGAERGTGRRIITEEDACVGIDPTTGGPIISKFTTGVGVDHPQGGIVLNGKVKVVG